jgi:HK97 family phage prohead protease
MPETKHFSTKASITESGDGQGIIEAAFSVFDVTDSDGDVVLRSAFKEGQEVPMVWSHNWDMPIGKGTVHVTPKQAVFKGNLWLDTEDGLQAFRKMRNAGTLQEFSWGFQILDAEPGVKDGQQVRFIKDATLFEVSPVLVGSNRATRLLSLKAAEPADAVDDPHPPEPDEPETLMDRLESAAAGVEALIKLAEDDGLVDEETRMAFKGVTVRLGWARSAIEAVLTRTDPIHRIEPLNQYRRFQELTARHGLSTTP